MSSNTSGGTIKPITQGETRIIAARWLGGGSASDCTRVSGSGVATVAYNTSTGCYAITLSNTFQVLESAHFTVMAATGAATSYIARPVSYTASTGVIQINVTDLATPTNHDLGTAEQLWFTLFLRDEGVYT